MKLETGPSAGPERSPLSHPDPPHASFFYPGSEKQVTP